MDAGPNPGPAADLTDRRRPLTVAREILREAAPRRRDAPRMRPIIYIIEDNKPNRGGDPGVIFR